MNIWEILVAAGIPSTITGLLVWWLKRKMEHTEAKQLEREANQEKLILMMMKSTRANNVGITAIARAVQRIPDAHCNGDMDSALETMELYANEEKDFLMEQGIKHIFSDE